jgi:hypothetical protein
MFGAWRERHARSHAGLLTKPEKPWMRMLACSDSDGNMAAYGECNMMSSRIFAKRK